MVDAPFALLRDDELPAEIQQFGTSLARYYHPERADPDDSIACLLLSRSGSYTPLHTDPIYGGGWMYLAFGCKEWLFVEPEYVLPLIDSSRTAMLDLPLEQILEIDQRHIYGHCHAAVCHAGDFVYFPPGYAHRVVTRQASFGVSGYLLAPCDRQGRIEALAQRYVSWGVGPTGNLWKGTTGNVEE